MKKSTGIAVGAVTAALYAALTIILAPIGFGAVQFRISEALTVLPYYTVWAVPGITAGCLIANILCSGSMWDIVFGTAATLIGAVGTWLCSKKKLWFLAPLTPFLSNTVIVSLFLTYIECNGTLPAAALAFNAGTVGLGEAVCCYGLGLALMGIINKYKKHLPI